MCWLGVAVVVGDTTSEGEALEEEAMEKEQQDVIQFKIHIDSGTQVFLVVYTGILYTFYRRINYNVEVVFREFCSF